MNSDNDLQISLGLDPTGLRQGLGDAENMVQSTSQRITASIERIGNLGQQLAGLGATMTASLTVPIVGLATASVKAYGDIQALQLGLESVAGSANYASKQFKDMQEVAKLPGLGLQEAINGSINLQAIGLSAGTAKNVLLQFGNAVSTVGKGRVELDRAIYGVQQLANTDFPLGEDLNIIKDALPQVSNLLKSAFGSSRSDELTKMGISSKQVLDTILKGLEKLPRVSGGIKNAFENLGDSIQQNLSRLGKVIDDAFDINGVINKFTDAIESVVNAFAELDPQTQKIILVVAGLVAGIGPLLLGLGGLMALLPIITSGVGALSAVMGALVSPVGLVAIALTALTAGFVYYINSQKDATREQDNWNDSLLKATISGEKEVANVDKLYKATQNHTLSLEERNKAVDQIQKEYPYYFENLSNEAILAGKAGIAYQNLKIDIINASKARAAQAELDRRASEDLKQDLERRKKFQQAVKDFKFPKEVKLASGGFEDKSFKKTLSAQEVKKIAQDQANALADEDRKVIVERKKRDADLLSIIGSGQDAVLKLNKSGADNLITATKGGTEKIKKAQEQQLSEIFPIGSIAELKQRASLLEKAIETTNNDIVKVRKKDALGKEIDKKGTPFYTGEILSLEQAYKRLTELKEQIDNIELKPIDLQFNEGMFDGLGNEFKNINDLLSNESARMSRILGTELPTIISNGAQRALDAQVAFAELTANFNRDLNGLVTDSIAGSLTDVFSSIGQAIGEGGNIIGAIGSSLIKSFGNFLSDLGGMLIKYGTLAVAKGTLDIIIQTGGYQAIVAGVAAIAVGAALSVAGSAIGSASSKGMNGSGSVSTQTGVSSGNNYSASYMSGGGSSSNEITLRVSGQDLIAVINRNVIENDKLNAG